MKRLSLLFVLLLSLNLTACSKLNNYSSANSQKQSGSINNSSNRIKNESLNDFIESIRPKEYEITQTIQDDIDGDNNNEILVSFGDKNDTDMGKYMKTYILRKTSDSFKKLGELKDNVGTITDIKIIKLDSSNKKYVFTTQTNGAGGIGCIVYNIKEDEISVVDKRFPATGKGVRTLVDGGNGIYKGVDYKEYNDIQKHKLTLFYIWDGNLFVKDNKEITYPYNKENMFVYPQKPEDVIQSYLEAVYVGADNEIKEIISNEFIKNFKVLDYFGENGGFEYGLYLSHETMLKNDNTFIIKTTDTSNNKFAYFKLINENGKWKIEDISTTQIN